MRSAMSITKSKTGEAILRTNRIERAGLKKTNELLRREKTFAEVDINKSKILFKAQYKKWMDYRNNMPEDIHNVKDKYKQLRKTITLRKMAKVYKKTSKWGPLPVWLINDLAHAQEKEQGASSNNESETKKWRSLIYSMGETALTGSKSRPIYSPDKYSRESRRNVAVWREDTFDMSSIRDLLLDQVYIG